MQSDDATKGEMDAARPGQKRKAEDDREPSHYEIFKRKAGPGSVIFDLTLPEDEIFSSLLVGVTPNSICPQLTLTRYRMNELSPRNFYLRKSQLSVLLSKMEQMDQLIKDHDLEKRIPLCDRSSIGLTVYHSIPYISLQYETGKGKSPFFFNIKQQEWVQLSSILKQIREERDARLRAVRESLDTAKPSAAPNQVTVYEVSYAEPETNQTGLQAFFNLEEGVRSLTDEGYSIIGTERRKVDLPSLSAVALMFASLLLRCKRDGLIENLDHVTLSRYVEAYFATISASPYVSSEILTACKFALETQRCVDHCFVSGHTMNSVLRQVNSNIPPNFIPDQPSGWVSALGIPPIIRITY